MTLTKKQEAERIKMLEREVRVARQVLRKYELFESSLVGLSAKVIATHGRSNSFLRYLS